jgi:uncharacterized protein
MNRISKLVANISNKISARIIALSILFIFPFVYWLNGSLYYSIEYWSGNTEYFSIFWISILTLHLISLLITFTFLRTLKDYSDVLNFGLNLKFSILFFSCLVITAVIALINYILDIGNNNYYSILQPKKLSESIIITVAYVIAAPIIEEIVYRGAIIGGSIRLGMNKWIAFIASVFLFNVIHGSSVFFSVEKFLFYTAGGAIFGLIYILTNRLWVSILLHFLLNLQVLMC